MMWPLAALLPESPKPLTPPTRTARLRAARRGPDSYEAKNDPCVPLAELLVTCNAPARSSSDPAPMPAERRLWRPWTGGRGSVWITWLRVSGVVSATLAVTEKSTEG